jgi:ABC-type multidrug transport system fused ATPase/permease subunit
MAGDHPPDGIQSSLFAYVWRVSGNHQILASFLAICIVALNLAPLEIQRRLFNNIVNIWDIPLLFWLGGAYVGFQILLQIAKFVFNTYQSWIGERAAFQTRLHLYDVYMTHLKKKHSGYAESQSGSEIGSAIEIIGNEVDRLAEFVGSGFSQAFANLAMLIGIGTYMLFVEPLIALFGLLFLLPQVVVVPIVQRSLNRLIRIRVRLLRAMANDVSSVDVAAGSNCLSILPKIFQNRVHFFLTKMFLKGVMNLLLIFPVIVVLVWGGYLAIQGETDIGTIVAFLSGFEKLSSPSRELAYFYRNAARANVQREMIRRWT